MVQTVSASDPPRSPQLPDVTNTFVDRRSGFSIDLPYQFQLTSEQRDVLFFQSPVRPGAILIKPTPGLTLATVQAAMRNGFESDRVKLTPIGSPMSIEINGGQGMGMEVEGEFEGVKIRGLLAGCFGPNKQGYVILVGAPVEEWPALEPITMPTLDSLTMFPARLGFEHERWQSRLTGRQLRYFDVAGYVFNWGAMSAEILLCSDGTFLERNESTGSYGGTFYRGTSSTVSRGKGVWRVQADSQRASLILDYSNDKRVNAPLSDGNGYIFVAGVPYSLTANSVCR
jgi:hypothetical protein